MTKLKDLQQDSRNANRGTAKGQKLLVKSVQTVGAARPGLLDKNNRVVAGNKSTEAFAEVFGVDVEPIIVESDGTRPIYHKRVDWDLDDPDPNNPARQAAYLDNATSFFNLSFDPAAVMADIEAGFEFEKIDITPPDLGEMLKNAADSLLKEGQGGDDDTGEIEIPELWGVVISCETEAEQTALLDEMIERGFKCRALM